MRNETEAARDAFYEHKESWERSITAELTAQVSALRDQVAAFDEDARRAKRTATELSLTRTEKDAAIDRLRSQASEREDELSAQLDALAQRHAQVTSFRLFLFILISLLFFQ